MAILTQEMSVTFMIRVYSENDIPQMIAIWNRVVEDGVAFPQTEPLDEGSGALFFAQQTKTCVYEEEDGNIAGLYILHPNNIGRAGHIGNASFAVSADKRGLHIGQALVEDCLIRARQEGFRIMQFNAVVDTNVHALRLYERMGFKDLGIIPGGFLTKQGRYEDIHVMYYDLTQTGEKPDHSRSLRTDISPE